MVASQDPSKLGEVANKVRGGMNRDQFQGPEKSKNEDDGDKEYYFDCTILDKLDSATVKAQQQDLRRENQEAKAGAGLDLMDFMSKNDFGGGQT